MFSSGEQSQENNSTFATQWALNQSAYQNMSNEEVDWAALAQQWIMMKESIPTENETPENKKEVLNEGGEAPMDVETEKEDSSPPTNENWNWHQWNSWPNNWNNPPPPPGVPAQSPVVSSANKTALLPTPYSPFPTSTDSNHTNDYPNFDCTTPPLNNFSSSHSTGYWTSNGNRDKQLSNKPHRMSRKNFSTSRLDINSESVTLDAAKRRQLPAWIKEGLEKMEREKQKQLEREREEKQTTTKDDKEYCTNENLMTHLQKSKFDTDSEHSSDENDAKSTQQSSHKPTEKIKNPSQSKGTSSVQLTEEERILLVRRAMTEILLQVTNSEILSVCQEEINRISLKTSASAKKGGRPAAPSADPSAVGSLGLNIYGSGSSDSEEDDVAVPSDQLQMDNNKEIKPEAGPSLIRSDSQNEMIRKQETHSGRPGGTRYKMTNGDNLINELKGSETQVDTTSSHDRETKKTRNSRRSSSSSSSSSSSESSDSDKNGKAKNRLKLPKKQSNLNSLRRDSSSSSYSDSSSNSEYSDSPRTSSQKHRSHRSRRSHSGECNKRKSTVDKNHNRRRDSRSLSTDSDSYKKRSTNVRNYDTRYSPSRSRYSDRSRRSRSRDYRRYSRRRSRSRSRSHSRHRRDSYRSRSKRNSRSRSRSRSNGGKRTRGH